MLSLHFKVTSNIATKGWEIDERFSHLNIKRKGTDVANCLTFK